MTICGLNKSVGAKPSRMASAGTLCKVSLSVLVQRLKAGLVCFNSSENSNLEQLV
jgi:hypothetical protein